MTAVLIHKLKYNLKVKHIKKVTPWVLLFFCFVFCVKNSKAQIENKKYIEPFAPEIYQHWDPKTTTIINSFSGKEKMPLALKAEVEIKMLFAMVASSYFNEKKYESLPAQLSNLYNKISKKLEFLSSPSDLLRYRQSSEYISDLIEGYYFSIWGGSVDTAFSVKLNNILNHFILVGYFDRNSVVEKSLQEKMRMVAGKINNLDELEEEARKNYSDKRYAAIWKMHKKHGNPRIDFSSGFYQAHNYSSQSNTVYFAPLFSCICSRIGSYGDNVNDYFLVWKAELAHAEQFKRYPANIMDARKEAEEKYRKIYGLENKDFYHIEITIEGYLTIEYEAHHKIQLELDKEYNDLIS